MSQSIVYCNSGDCWADKTNDFSTTGTLYVIDKPGVTNANIKTWIPFTVGLRNVEITSAYITLRSATTSDGATGDLIFACEAADNPSTPVSGSDLNGRSLSAYQATHAIGGWSLDEVLTFQIDNPIQETLARPGWKPGNTLAVVIYETSIGDSPREVYSYETSPGARAYLTLNYKTYVPRAGGML